MNQKKQSWFERRRIEFEAFTYADLSLPPVTLADVVRLVWSKRLVIFHMLCVATLTAMVTHTFSYWRGYDRGFDSGTNHGRVMGERKGYEDGRKMFCQREWCK